MAFIVSAIISTAVYIGIETLETESQSDLRRAHSQFERARSSVELIAEEEATILENIDEYQLLSTQGIMKEEDRLQFLEDIAVMRDELHLFPINLSIEEQYNARLEYPQGAGNGGPIDLASSNFNFSMPLLHEEDFLRFLARVRDNGGLYQIKECILGLRNTGAKNFTALQQHMNVSCVAVWYTYNLSPDIEQPGLLGADRGFL